MFNRIDIDSQKGVIDHEDDVSYENLSMCQREDVLENNPIDVGDDKKRQRTRIAQSKEGIVERKIV